MNVRVAALTGGKNKPSSRFRVRQHIAPLANHGVEVDEVVPALDKHWELLPLELRKYKLLRRPVRVGELLLKAGLRLPALAASHNADVTWLQRELLPGVVSLEPLLKRPWVLDVDDAIWKAPPMGERTCRWIAERCRTVIAGNEYLAGWFGLYAEDIRIVPTAVDTERFCPPDKRANDKFVIGWIGTSANLKYVEQFESAYRRVLDACPQAEFLFVCDRAPKFDTIGADRVRFVPWSREVEVSCVQEMHVGLMPLADEEWARGKCAYKMLQYMACGAAVVVSPVGMNQTVLDEADVGLAARSMDDWVDALVSLAADADQCARLGEAGRTLIVKKYSTPVVAAQLATIFKDAAF